MELGSGYLIRT